VFNHTELGQIDFSESTECFSTLLWHSNVIDMKVILGRSLKDVTTGITFIVGRMKALPAWTQKGAIVGLQGT
jgi:alpha-glucosidase (family GH31 glycosyl hydrolase)